MNIKNIFISVRISFLFLSLTACDNSGESSKKYTLNIKSKLPTVPKNVFSSDKNNDLPKGYIDRTLKTKNYVSNSYKGSK